MSKNTNKPFFGKEILFNSKGQIYLKKILIRFTTQFYRSFLEAHNSGLECTPDKRKVSSSNLLGPK